MNTWCSKHVEAWNKLIVKFFASNLLITKTNVLRCTVSKTSKYEISPFHGTIIHELRICVCYTGTVQFYTWVYSGFQCCCSSISSPEQHDQDCWLATFLSLVHNVLHGAIKLTSSGCILGVEWGRRLIMGTFIVIIVQRDATQSSLFIILQVQSTCFGCQPHPSSGVHKTGTTASGTRHIFLLEGGSCTKNMTSTGGCS